MSQPWRVAARERGMPLGRDGLGVVDVGERHELLRFIRKPCINKRRQLLWQSSRVLRLEAENEHQARRSLAHCPPAPCVNEHQIFCRDSAQPDARESYKTHGMTACVNASGMTSTSPARTGTTFLRPTAALISHGTPATWSAGTGFPPPKGANK
jgi:hypothetical protein